MKTSRKKHHMYSKMLYHAPLMNKGDILVQDSSGRLKKISPLDVSFEGVSLRTYKKLYNDELSRVNQFKDEIKDAEFTLTGILLDGGYSTSNVDLKSLIRDINSLLIIKPQNEYEMLTFNQDGYVNGSTPLGGLIKQVSEKPDDFANGYYKFIDGKFVLDEERYRQYWGVV